MAEFCPFCMRPGSGKYCKYCGGEIAFRGKEFQLPVGTHLMGSEVPYLIGASIGQGGFGVTYAALNCASGERVAILSDLLVRPEHKWEGCSCKGKLWSGICSRTR